jgi:hypothetical protein
MMNEEKRYIHEELKTLQAKQLSAFYSIRPTVIHFQVMLIPCFVPANIMLCSPTRLGGVHVSAQLPICVNAVGMTISQAVLR